MSDEKTKEKPEKIYPSARNLIFTDTETTGLDPTQHEMVSLACVVLNPKGTRIGWGQWFMHPRWPERAEEKALEVNGYTREAWDAKGVVSHEQAMTEYKALSEGGVFIAHNVSFDWSFVEAELERSNIEWTGDYHKLDTPSMFWPFYLTVEGFNGIGLWAVCEYYGIANEGAHDSLVDVERLVKAYQKMMEFFRRDDGTA